MFAAILCNITYTCVAVFTEFDKITSKCAVESQTFIAASILFSLPLFIAGIFGFNNYLFFFVFLEEFKKICKKRLLANRTEDIVGHCRYCLNLFKKIQNSLGMLLKNKKGCHF